MRGDEGAGGGLRADLLWLLPGPARLKLRHTKHGALEGPLLVLSHIRLLATLNMALTEGCIPLDPTRDSSREVCPDPGCSRPASRRRHSHCRRRRSSSVSIVGCNGDWAAAAEVTPGRGSRSQTCARGELRNRSSGVALLWGRRQPFCLSFLLCRPADPGSRCEAGSRCVPGAGGQAGQPWGRSGRRHCTLRQARRDAVGAEGGGDTLR